MWISLERIRSIDETILLAFRGFYVTRHLQGNFCIPHFCGGAVVRRTSECLLENSSFLSHRRSRNYAFFFFVGNPTDEVSMRHETDRLRSIPAVDYFSLLNVTVTNPRRNSHYRRNLTETFWEITFCVFVPLCTCVTYFGMHVQSIAQECPISFQTFF